MLQETGIVTRAQGMHVAAALRFRFRFRTTCPRLQHSRRGTQKTRGSQPPQGGLLGPAWKGRSGRPVAAPRATGGRHLPSFGGGSACGVGWGARAAGGSPAQGRQCAAGVGLDGVGEGAAGKAQRGPRSATASRLAPTCFHLKKTGPSGSVGRWCGVLGDVSWLCGGPQGVSCCNCGPARTCFASLLCGACGKTGRAGRALDGGRSRFGPVMHVQGRATGAPHRDSVG